MKTKNTVYSEFEQDWSALPLPENTKFPLVGMEDRKKIALGVSSKAALKYYKANDIDEIIAESMAAIWDESLILEFKTKKDRIPSDDVDKQRKFFAKFLTAFIRSLCRYSGCVNQCRIGDMKRVRIYDDNNEITPSADKKMSEFDDKKRRNEFSDYLN